MAPDLVICKKRTGANSWPVYHRAAPTGALLLDLTNANDTSSFLFAQKDPTSTQVFLGNNPEINNSSHNYVAYCFAPVEGYSAFGTYTGNGSADGPFVYTGFRPRFLLMRTVDSVSIEDWFIFDTERDPFNVSGAFLRPNQSAAEGSSFDLIDILSNGFKYRYAGGGLNTSSETIIYAAFAENPFKTARAR